MAAWGYEFCVLMLKVSLTRSLRSLVRYFQHSKIKSVSPRGHVISSIYETIHNFYSDDLEPPCLRTAVWKQGSNTCNHLNNSTNNIWYEVGRGYYSSIRWCDAFRDCFGFTDVRKRCRLDFDFYFRAPPKFTTEILSYLPYARIQVSYVCSKRYTFAVNVIRCNSGSKLNGMF